MSKPLTLITKAISMDRRRTNFVWPGKCYCTGVNVASILEMLKVLPEVARPVGAAQVSDQSPHTFSESLHAVSRAFSGTNTVTDGASTRAGRRQKPSAEDANPAVTVVAIPPPPPSPHAVHQQLSVAQQSPLIDSAIIPPQPPLTGPVASPYDSTAAVTQPMRDTSTLGLSGIESNLACGVQSAGLTSSQAQKNSDPPQAKSVLPWPKSQSPEATLAPESPTASNTAANAIANAIPSGVSTAAVQRAFPSFVPAVVAAVARQSMATAVPIAKTVPGEVADRAQNPNPNIVSNAMPDAISNAAPVPVLHAALNAPAKGEVASSSNRVLTGQANQPVSAPDGSGFATGLSLPVPTANQLVALIQPGGGLLGAPQAAGTSLSSAPAARTQVLAGANGKDEPANAVNDATGLKQHSQSASNQTGSQETASSGDQSQGSAPPQVPSAAPAQMSFASHAVAIQDHAQNTGIAPLLQTAPTIPGIAIHTAKAPDTPVPVTVAVPQPLPAINTAKLIQSMGQSELRVGMRSNDFGNISISTSATRDLISAQISVDHGELARTLAAHLPDMQARLRGHQAMDVRIDMNGQSAGYIEASLSNGSADQSSGERRQKGSPASRQFA